MRRIIKLIILVFLLGLVFSRPGFIYGQDDPLNNEVNQLNNDIQNKKDRIKQIKDKQSVYSSLIAQKQSEKANLSNQLAILDNRIANAELDLESAQTDIDRVNLEIKKVNLEIDDENKKIVEKKDHLATVLRIIQQEGDKTSLEIMLQNNSLVDFVNQIKYLEDVNNEIGNNIEAIKEYKKQLEEQNNILAVKQNDLNNLKADLENKKITLVSEQEDKNYILEQTKSSESEYQRLLRQAKAEQQKIESDIVDIEKTVREKLAKIKGQKLGLNFNGFIWPVPKNVITAYFHDQNYPFRYVFEHPAIDIRAAQGSPVKAAASGYVAQAKNGGMGYSYIMIIHGNGLATVYGHVSKIFVSPDEYVSQGQVIGLSGGLPGTPGAGKLTTGAHLHFEVRMNGIPVNPLDYLQ